MAAIGLKSQIWNNNIRSIALLAFYPFLIAGLCWAMAFGFYYSFAPEMGTTFAFYSGDMQNVQAAANIRGDSATTFANNAILAHWPLILTVVLIWFTIAYFLQGTMIKKLSHAHSVTRAEEPELYNMLENLCITRGMTTPKLQIIETHARNAFASGITDSTYTVTVTRGLLQSLRKDEVEAVLAHELTHIENRDVRLLIVSIIFTGMIGFFAQMAWSIIRYNMVFGGRRRKSDGRIVMVLFAFAAILWVGYMATMFTRFALSRRREYMADAGAVEMTKNPEAMMRALLRLSGKDKIPEATGDIAMMCIENSSKFLGLFTTHPPLAQRIKAISEVTNTPIPELKPGYRAEERFKHPDERKNPWLTATRGKRNPWSGSRAEPQGDE